jgi:Ca2+-binding RTX toxin-like protein
LLNKCNFAAIALSSSVIILRNKCAIYYNIGAFLMATIQGTEAADNLIGTDSNDEIFGLGGDDTFSYSPGTDTIGGGEGFDSVIYADFVPITAIFKAPNPSGPSFPAVGEIQIDKFPSLSSDSIDTLKNVERIVGSKSQENTLDLSGLPGDGGRLFYVTTNVDLSTNQINIRGANPSEVIYQVENFANVIGTSSNNILRGDAGNNRLVGLFGEDQLFGGAGNDFLFGGENSSVGFFNAGAVETLDGGNGNDVLLGADAGRRVAGEEDILTGGNGRDQFILGDRKGSYYANRFGSSQEDLARIKDFSRRDVIELGAGETYKIQLKSTGFDIAVVRADRETGQDMIAEVTTMTPRINRILAGFADPGSNRSTITLTAESGETVLGGLFSIAWTGGVSG